MRQFLLTGMLMIALLGATPGAAEYLQNASDSLLVLPKPLLGLEKGELRYGIQFSAMKTLLHLKGGFTPYLEGGITLFDRIDRSPDDKKHLFLKIGCLWDIGFVALSLESGLLYGNGDISATSGVGVWKILPFTSGGDKKTLKDFSSYRDYVRWRNRYLKESKKTIKGCAFSLRLFFNYQIQPALSGGLFFDLFL